MLPSHLHKLIVPRHLDICFWQALGGLAGLAGSIYQGEQNKKMMREQMKFQTSEREASQGYQTSERLGMQGFQDAQRNAQNQFAIDMYEKYQSPQALAAQYREAGLNPALAVQGGAGDVSASSGSTGGAPSSGAPVGAHINPPYQSMNSIADSINATISGLTSIAKAKKDLADAKKTGVETDKVGAVMDAQANNLNSLAQEALSKAALNEVVRNLKERFGPARENAEIKRFLAEASKLTWDAEEAKSRINSLKLDNDYKQKLLAYFDTDKQHEYQESEERVRLNRSIIRVNKSQYELNQSLKNLNISQEEKNKVETAGQRIANNLADLTFGDVVHKTHEEAQAIKDKLSAEIEMLKQIAYSAKQRGDQETARTVNSYLNTVVDATALAIPGGLPAKTIKGFVPK